MMTVTVVVVMVVVVVVVSTKVAYLDFLPRNAKPEQAAFSSHPACKVGSCANV